MDEIKKIWFESAISRIPGLLPFIEFINDVPTYVYPSPSMYNGNYGKFVVDVKIDDDRFKVPDFDGDDECKDEFIPVSYRELHNMYMEFMNTPPKLDEDIKLFNSIKEVFGLVDVPSNIEGINVPTFFYLPELSEWRDWFNKTAPFCSGSGGTSSNCSDCCLCIEYKNRGGDMMLNWLNTTWKMFVDGDEWKLVKGWKNGQGYIQPFKNENDTCKNKLYASLSCNVMLTSDVDALGIGSSLIKEWVPGEKYYLAWYNGEEIKNSGLGNGVIYNGEIYFLKNNISGDKADWSLPSGETDRYEYVHGFDSNLRPYYVGLYDKMYQELLFDYERDGKFIHWEKSIDNDILKHYYNITSATTPSNYVSEITTVTQSRLSSFKRLKNSVDDNGNVLPGIYNGTNELELPYLEGTTSNIVVEVDDNNNVIGAVGNIIKEINEMDNQVIFTYLIGAELRVSGDSFKHIDGDYEGIKYVDVYGLITSSMTATITTIDKTVEYDKDNPLYFKILDTINCKTVITNTELNDALNDISSTSGTTYISTPYSAVTDYSPYIYQDYLIGTVSNPVVDANVQVDRGTAAAFERHIKLGEVKTLDDMVNYGNGFFNLVEQS